MSRSDSCIRSFPRAASLIWKCCSIFVCTNVVSAPDSSHAIRANPRAHAKKYLHFDRIRKSRSFIAQDSSLASLLRMYELILCGLDEQLALEAEYFWNRKWQVSKIPNTIPCAWERDTEREQVCHILTVILVDAFNYHISSNDLKRSKQEIPSWAKGVNESIGKLHERYPALGNLYFFLPWRHISFVHPPSSPRSIIYNKAHFEGVYKHHARVLQMPLFVSIDTPLSSVCRLYELSILVEGSNLQHAYAMELDYFFKHSGWQDLSASQVSDPRQRWKNLDVREPEVFSGLIDVVKKLVVVEENKYGGSGKLPVWAGGDDPGRS